METPVVLPPSPTLDRRIAAAKPGAAHAAIAREMSARRRFLDNAATPPAEFAARARAAVEAGIAARDRAYAEALRARAASRQA